MVSRSPFDFSVALALLLLGLSRGRGLLWPDRVGGALNESLDLHHVRLGQFAGEIGHALVAEGSLEDKILQVVDGLGGDVAEISDVPAVVDSRHAVTLRTGGDIDRGALRHVFRIVLHAREQAFGLVFYKSRRRRLAVDCEGIDRTRALIFGRAYGDSEYTAPADGDRDILLAVDHVGRGRRDHAGAGRRLPKLLARGRIISDKASVCRALEYKIAGCRERTAVPWRYILSAPGFLLLHGIPSQQSSKGLVFRRGRIQHEADVPAGGAGEFSRRRRVLAECLFRRQIQWHALRRQIDEAGLRIERHRMPVVGAVWAGDAVIALGPARRRHLDRPSIGVVAGRPVHIDEVFRRDELAVGAVDHEEEAVLRRVQDDFPRRAVDVDVGEDHRLRG